MVIGSCCDCFWIVSAIPAALYEEKPGSTSFFVSEGFIYFITLFGAVADGFGDALMWTAHGTYVQECSTESTKGFYFGYFWSIYMFSQVIGNLTAAFVLGKLPLSEFYLIMSSLAFLAIICFCLLKNPIKQ